MSIVLSKIVPVSFLSSKLQNCDIINSNFTYLIVGKWISNGRKSFNGNGNRHVDRAHHHDHLSWVQEVGEQLDMDVRLEVETLPEAFQDGSEQVPSVKEGEEDQHEVETVNVTQK